MQFISEALVGWKIWKKRDVAFFFYLDPLGVKNFLFYFLFPTGMCIDKCLHWRRDLESMSRATGLNEE